MLFPWYSSMMLTVESSCVIALRLTKITLGGWESLRRSPPYGEGESRCSDGGSHDDEGGRLRNGHC